MNITMKEQLSVLKNQMFKEEVQETKIDKIEHINKLMGRYADNKPQNNIYNKKIIVYRSEVYWARLDGSEGSEQGGRRPVIIIQNDVGNTYSPTTIVAVITSKLDKAKLPVHVELSKEINDMPEDSVILFEQIRTLDKRRLQDKICQLDEFTMKKIDKALGISVGIPLVEEPKVEIKKESPLEKLDKNLRKNIEDKLDDIYTYEKAISKAKNQSLINNLLEQREAFLWSLQKFCEDNKLNYRDYYEKYDSERETIAM